MRRRIISSYQLLFNKLKVLSLEMLFVLLSFLGSMLLIIFLVKQVFHTDAFLLDEKVFSIFEGYVSDATTSFMSSFTYLGSHYFLVPANLILMIYAFFLEKNRWLGIKITAIAFSSLIMMLLLKLLFNRQRPLVPLLEEVPGLSFPSGHAFMSFTFFGLLIYFIYKEVDRIWLRIVLQLLCVAMIVIIGLSRIYLRVHYFSDVLAGLSFGLIWLVISLTVLNALEKRSKREMPIN